MKIALCSDIHLEFENPCKIMNTESADVLILAGDICVADDLYKHKAGGEINDRGKFVSSRSEMAWTYREFLTHVSKEFPHVLYVIGNHEHYKGKFDRTLNILQLEAARISSNITILEKDHITLGGVTFYGATMWTNCNNHNKLTEYTIANGLNDYSKIRVAEAAHRRLRVSDTILDHVKAVSRLQVLAHSTTSNIVVISHHAPSTKSVQHRYLDDFHMAGGYCSDLSNLILDNPHIKLWVHGHIHEGSDYMIGDTRVVCNPKGYYDVEYQPMWIDL